MKDHIWKIIGIVAVVAIGASVVYSNSVANKANEGVVFETHVKGSKDAKVILTEYSDFQCPACAQFAVVVEQVLETYPTDVKLEYKHFPLISIHPLAVPAAKAAEAAGQQGKFFEMHDKLFENQQVWANSGSPGAYFNTYAEEIGLDVKRFKTHMKASLIEDKITDEFKEARGHGLTGTPSFFLNGERMEFETYEDFMGQIEAAVNGTETAESAEIEATPDVTFGL